MKKLNLLFTALLLMCYVGTAKAHDFEFYGIYYNITSSYSKTAEVTYKGSSYDSYNYEYSGSVVIPERVTYNGTTYSVTSIDSYAFWGCSRLTSVTIGNSVTSIGHRAFQDCSGLTSITIPNSVTSIDSYAFYGCSGLTSITIPNNVTSIGYYAFYGCSGLTSITIPNSVTSIDSNVFCGCSGLESIVVDPRNTKYDSRDNCNAIIETESNTLLYGCKNTVIPNSVTSIGYSAFNGCSGLTSIEIPNSVTSIGYIAFYNCTSLTSVTIGNSVTSISGSAFKGCSGLTSITIPNSVTSIGDDAFIYCTGLTSITIPNSVTSIGDWAFEGCSGLTSITIPNSVTSIGGYVFKGCSGLTSITIPNSVTSIGKQAFYSCSGLTSITIPNSVTSIGESAFSDCSGLTSITIPNSVTSIGKQAFSGCSGLKKVELNCKTVGGWFSGNKSIEEVVIGNSVTSMGDYAFQNCSGLTSITIPNSVKSIGYQAFYGCNNLKTVYNFSNLAITKGSTNYGYIAYYANEVYNDSDGSIEGDYIFGKPNNVNTLLYYLGNETELTLPADYKGESYVIGENVFKDNKTITSIEIPNSVTSIGNYAFDGCSGLTSITIPNSATSIGEYAFACCDGLTSITIPNSVTSIGTYAFCSCSGLTSITIPNSVTSIGDDAFRACRSMEELYIGSSIESIGDNAFAACDKIKEIKIALERPFAASTNIFSSTVYDNAVLYIPNGAKSRYEKREPWNLFFDIVEMDFTGITLDKKTVTLTEGNTTTLVAIVNLDGTTDNDVVWTTSDSAVATVEGGVVTAVAPATATITATVGGYSASCTVTVTASPKLSVYHIYQPYHSRGATSWAVERGGNELKSNVDLGIELDSNDPRQQFAILSDDGGNTSFLYHVLESKFICKDGSLSETPVDAIKFMNGAYNDTFFAYFDSSHYVNIGGSRQMIIDGWNTPDRGNSCVLLPVGEFDPTEALEAIHDFTGIEDVASDSKNEKAKSKVVYDLRGRKLSEITAPGIYIIDGKKTFVK